MASLDLTKVQMDITTFMHTQGLGYLLHKYMYSNAPCEYANSYQLHLLRIDSILSSIT